MAGKNLWSEYYRKAEAAGIPFAHKQVQNDYITKNPKAFGAFKDAAKIGNTEEADKWFNVYLQEATPSYGKKDYSHLYKKQVQNTSGTGTSNTGTKTITGQNAGNAYSNIEEATANADTNKTAAQTVVDQKSETANANTVDTETDTGTANAETNVETGTVEEQINSLKQQIMEERRAIDKAKENLETAETELMKWKTQN